MLELQYEVAFKVEDKDIVLYNPYLTNDLKVGFRMCNLFSGVDFKEMVFDDSKNTINFIGYKKTYSVKISKDENIEAVLKVAEIKNKIVQDLCEYNNRLAQGKEFIMAILIDNDNDCNMQYLFTTKTSLYNGGWSVKYNNAIVYYLNKEAVKLGKKIEFKDYTDMELRMNKAFKGFDLSKLQLKALNEVEKYYAISFETMAKLLLN